MGYGILIKIKIFEIDKIASNDMRCYREVSVFTKNFECVVNERYYDDRFLYCQRRKKNDTND